MNVLVYQNLYVLLVLVYIYIHILFPIDNIDDDTIVEFFKECGGEIIGLRWLTHKDSGEFKGCGYIEFDNSDAADKAIAYDGAMVLGR